MSIESQIQATLAALVAGRCYPMVAPQGVARPYITFQFISNAPQVSLDGANGTKQHRVQIDAYADSYGAAKALEKGVEDAMQSADFTSIPLSSNDLYESEVQLYRVTMDYSIWS